MLVLDRKKLQKIKIGDDITFTILTIKGKEVRVVIDAPDDIIDGLIKQTPSAHFSNKIQQHRDHTRRII